MRGQRKKKRHMPITVKATNGIHFSLLFKGNQFVMLQQYLLWQHYKVYFYFLDNILALVHGTSKASYFWKGSQIHKHPKPLHILC